MVDVQPCHCASSGMWFTGLTSRCLLSVSREPRNPLGPRAIKGRGVAAPAVMPMPVSVTANVIQSRQLPIYREVRDKFVNVAAPPASTTLEISKLAREGALLEVEAIAVLPAR
jgi:hypothetical protein